MINHILQNSRSLQRPDISKDIDARANQIAWCKTHTRWLKIQMRPKKKKTDTGPGGAYLIN